MTLPRKTLNTGVSMPILGMGTWLMGGDAQRHDNPTQDATDIKALRHGIEHGITHIDTASLYGDGHTEELVGDAISVFQRDSILLATKAAYGHHTKPLLCQAIDNSLTRLKTDYIDLYYLHRRTIETPLAETAEALNKAYEAGKIRAVGVCNFSPKSLDELQGYLKPRIIANQVHYNLSFREPEHTGLLTHAHDRDYFIVAWRPIKLVKRNTLTPSVPHNIWDIGAFPVLDEIARKYGKTNIEIALNWVTHHPRVTTLIKSSSPRHLDEAAASFSFCLSDEDYSHLGTAFQPQFMQSDTVPLE